MGASNLRNVEANRFGVPRPQRLQIGLTLWVGKPSAHKLSAIRPVLARCYLPRSGSFSGKVL